MPLRSHSIRVEKRLLWSLATGFGAVVLIMLVSGFFLLRGLQLVGAGAQRLSGKQLAQMELVDRLQREQGAVGELLYAMVLDTSRRQVQEHGQEGSRLREAIARIIGEARQQGPLPDEVQAWNELETAAALLFRAVEENLPAASSATQQKLALNHRRFVAAISRLLDTSYRDARMDQTEEMRRVADQFTVSAALLGVAVGLAIAGAVGSIIAAFRLFGRLEQQAGTLRSLALHILDEQELAARRFSQELHDEFGQTLNAIEATLSVINASSAEDRARLEDARAMVKDSIANAREMARLLRPAILDDFGLEPGLRELARGFSQRTGIVVDYRSDVRDRFGSMTETHLYRIAQEALTNVSRHSSARHVSIELKRSGKSLVLNIEDDGQGMPKLDPTKPRNTLGLIGMAERAQAVRGKIQMHSKPGKGVQIIVQVPVTAPAAAAADQEVEEEQEIHQP